MKATLFSLTLTLTFLTTVAQDKEVTGRNSLFFEAFGNGFFYSINYDRILTAKDNWKIAGRVGLTYVNTFKSDNRQMKGMPLEISYLKGTDSHFLELGIGFTPIYDTYGTSETFMLKELILISTFRIGYRYQKESGGFFFKGGLTPLGGIALSLPSKGQIKYQNHDFDSFVYPWAGIGIGYTLKN